MKQDKQIKEDSVRKYKAAKGHVLPIFYKGSIIRIDEKSEVAIDLEDLSYEGQFQLSQALKSKFILEIGE